MMDYKIKRSLLLKLMRSIIIIHGCTDHFVWSTVIKEGSCPALEPGTIGLCIQDCYDDGGCPDNMKCCGNGCGRVCIKPAPG